MKDEEIKVGARVLRWDGRRGKIKKQHPNGDWQVRWNGGEYESLSTVRIHVIKPTPVLRIKGHKLTMEWSGEYGEESSSTGYCTCGWQESGSSQSVVRFEYRAHLKKWAEGCENYGVGDPVIEAPVKGNKVQWCGQCDKYNFVDRVCEFNQRTVKVDPNVALPKWCPKKLR